MKEKKSISTERHNFITKIVPGCALACLYGPGLLAKIVAGAGQEKKENLHKFDGQISRQLTYRQYYALMYGQQIDLSKALVREMGQEKAIKFLKKFTYDRLFEFGQSLAKKAKDNSLNSYVEMFRDKGQFRFKNTLFLKIIKDMPNIFEFKVTECIWAAVCFEQKAPEIGLASICYGDYAHVKGFNSKLELVRDKTLMQGHDCCNHKYIWKG